MSATEIPSSHDQRGCTVAVYCWSRTEPGTKLWTQAEALGRLLVQHNFSVATGGYGGSMEAVSKGAREALDARLSSQSEVSVPAPAVIGVLVPGVFPDRARCGNPYLTVTKNATSVLSRIELLMMMSQYFVILPGTLGTLQELSCVWVSRMLSPADAQAPVVIAFREPWERCLRGIAEALQLPDEHLQLIQLVNTAEEAMEIIRKNVPSAA